ncbi:aldo/keto reductase [Bradyrhizobium sp. 2TAF24]|uniref:aldo/keto reductase n=1 Tax=Bradyrhizobium sp. 2TAF24 TaxID=3233011 RepID=UPI003F93A041
MSATLPSRDRPRTDGLPRLSPVGFGAFPLGGADGTVAVERARACLNAARDSGCTWVDTGEVYHGAANEDLLGRAGLQGLAVATKVAPRPAGSGLRPHEIRAACQNSLRRLRVNVIDWYYLHWPDGSGIPVEDSWGAMRALVDEGWVRHAGLSNFDIPLMQRCQAAGTIDVVQVGLSLVDHHWGGEVARWCGGHGIAVTLYEPLANGLLSGAVTAGTDLRAWAGRDVQTWPFFQRVLTGEALARSMACLEALHRWSAVLERPVAQVALAWGLAQPGVTSVLPGSRDPEHIRLNAHAAAFTLPSEVLAALDRVAGCPAT